MQELVTDCEWTEENLQQKLDELNKKLAIQDLEPCREIGRASCRERV